MRRRRSLVLTCLLAVAGGLAPPLAAQDTGQPTSREAGNDPLAAEIAAIIGEYAKAQQDFYAKIQGIEDEAEVSRLFNESYPDSASYAARVQAALDGHETEPGAAAGLAWIVEQSHDQAVREHALEMLRTHHLAAPELQRVVQTMSYGQAASEDAFLEAVVRDAPLRTSRARRFSPWRSARSTRRAPTRRAAHGPRSSSSACARSTATSRPASARSATSRSPGSTSCATSRSARRRRTSRARTWMVRPSGFPTSGERWWSWISGASGEAPAGT
jgi:hypothetical protein